MARKNRKRPAGPRRQVQRTRPSTAPPFDIGDAITREHHATPYDRSTDREPGRPGDPLAQYPATRRLAVYTQDPATSRLDMAVAEVSVPYEPLGPGPDGAVVRVVDFDATAKVTHEPLDLDALPPGTRSGLRPSTTNRRFAQQMVYAVTMVTYERFRQALGRTPDFAFAPHPEDAGGGVPLLKLHIRPHGIQDANAYYDPDQGALIFGYTYATSRAVGFNQPGSLVLTALSHDIVVHEMTHALVDGMRARFMLPSNPDVGAFHEALADLVAIFQRFQYTELVVRAIERGGGALTSRLLTDIARQFGQATGDGAAALRSALVAAGGPEDEVPDAFTYERTKEAHDLGAVLVAAVFDAFRWVFERKTAAIRRLAAAREGHVSRELAELLAGHATKLAGQFLNIVIRAVDYCPPVDVTFGEYLRAMVTADYDLVPDDPWGYREALVQAFRRYGIVVDGVPDLSEEALLWRPPERELGEIPGLAFRDLRHGNHPGMLAGTDELRRRATALGAFVSVPDRLYYFGLAAPRGGAERVDPPRVESVRALLRVGPERAPHFDLVAEVTTRRRMRGGYWIYGGSTIIIDSSGRVRYAVCKYVGSKRRTRAFAAYLEQAPAPYREYFRETPPSPARLLRLLHSNNSENSNDSSNSNRRPS